MNEWKTNGLRVLFEPHQVSWRCLCTSLRGHFHVPHFQWNGYLKVDSMLNLTLVCPKVLSACAQSHWSAGLIWFLRKFRQRDCVYRLKFNLPPLVACCEFNQLKFATAVRLGTRRMHPVKFFVILNEFAVLRWCTVLRRMPHITSSSTFAFLWRTPPLPCCSLMQLTNRRWRRHRFYHRTVIIQHFCRNEFPHLKQQHHYCDQLLRKRWPSEQTCNGLVSHSITRIIIPIIKPTN